METETKQYNIVVLVPMGRNVEVDFFHSLLNFLLRLKEEGHNFDLYTTAGIAHANARNKLYQHALDRIRLSPAPTHILWIDSDHKFNPTQVYQMISIMEEFKLPTLSAGYFIRSDISGLCAMSADTTEGGTDIKPAGYKPMTEFKTDMLYEVACVGMGMFLMDPKTLKTLEEKFGKVVFEFVNRNGRLIGEDVGFCERLRECGFKIYVHTGIMIGHIDSQVIDIDFVRARLKFQNENTIQGWLQDAEGDVLYQVASGMERGGVAVEIGSWKGKSAVRIARGIQDGIGSKLYCVDPFTGNIEVEASSVPVPSHSGKETFTEFMRNIVRTGVFDIVVPVKKLSKDALDDVKEPISFLYIDGDHTYEGVKSDFELWEPKVKIGGTIGFHDSNWPGVERLLKESFLNNEKFVNVKRVGSLTYGVKVK